MPELQTDLRTFKLVKQIEDVLQKKNSGKLFDLIKFTRHELLFQNSIFASTSNNRSPIYMLLAELISSIDKHGVETEFKDKIAKFIATHSSGKEALTNLNKK